jgi:DNA-binding MarR family transcriptional regulator/N-acetylglutamate synthase-like GNAT family acetyltransferase
VRPVTATARPARNIERRVEAVRRFARFYTRRIGVLQDRFLQSPFSLAEARVLYELTQSEATTATAIASKLGLDAGYLSRMLRGFAQRGLIARTVAPDDRRRTLLSLTARGRKAFAPLEKRSHDEAAAMLRKLAAADQDRVVAAMGTIERLIGERPAEADRPAVMLRAPQPGDMGWVVARHGALYAQDYGWGARFEGLVAEIVAEMIVNHDPTRERFWIADMAGEPVGSVFVVKAADDVAKLRLLLVEPSARGLGIGARLVDECVSFARAAGYKKMTLWTHSVLTAARHIYQNAGFARVAQTSHAEWGVEVVSETWEMEL